jgi:hypothetical protein
VSVKLHWAKAETLQIVEQGVLMKVRYRRRFGNPKILLERGAKLENFRK